MASKAVASNGSSPGDIPQVSPAAASSSNPRSKLLCRRCQNHQNQAYLAGHRRKCPYRGCICLRCSEIDRLNEAERRRAKQLKEERKKSLQLLELWEKEQSYLIQDLEWTKPVSSTISQDSLLKPGPTSTLPASAKSFSSSDSNLQISYWPPESVPDTPLPLDYSTKSTPTVTSTIPLTSFASKKSSEDYGPTLNPRGSTKLRLPPPIYSFGATPNRFGAFRSAKLNQEEAGRLTHKERTEVSIEQLVKLIDYPTLKLLLEHCAIRQIDSEHSISRKLAIERELAWLTDSVTEFTDFLYKLYPWYFQSSALKGSQPEQLNPKSAANISFSSSATSVIVANPTAQIATVASEPEIFKVANSKEEDKGNEIVNEPNEYPITKKQRAALMSKLQEKYVAK